MAVSFYGNGETTGAIANRKGIVGKPLPIPPGAICETTGSCGYLRQTPNIEDLEKDVVSFRGKNDNKKHSIFGTILSIGALAAIVIGGLAGAEKYKLVDKISNARVKGWLKNSDKITKPCYDVCKKAQKFCLENYDKILKKIKK